MLLIYVHIATVQIHEVRVRHTHDVRRRWWLLLGWWWHSRCLLIVRLAKQLTVSHTEVLAGTEYFLAVDAAEAV